MLTKTPTLSVDWLILYEVQLIRCRAVLVMTSEPPCKLHCGHAAPLKSPSSTLNKLAEACHVWQMLQKLKAKPQRGGEYGWQSGAR